MGDPKHRKEASNESVQKINTCGLGMQIPCGVVPEVSIQDTERGGGKVSTGYHTTVVQLEADRDSGRQCTDRPYTSGDRISAEILSSRSGRISEGKKCNKAIRSACGVEEAILGPAFLGKRVLRKHRGPK